MKIEYKVGMWVSFVPTDGSYGVIMSATQAAITVRWLDEFYVGESSMTYYIDPVDKKNDSSKLIRILPPVIAAFYEGN